MSVLGVYLPLGNGPDYSSGHSPRPLIQAVDRPPSKKRKREQEEQENRSAKMGHGEFVYKSKLYTSHNIQPGTMVRG